MFDVLVGVPERNGGSAVSEFDGDVGQIAPIRARRQRNEMHARLDECRHLLANVVVKTAFGSPTNETLKLRNGLAAVIDDDFVGAVVDFGQVAHGIPDGDGAEGRGFEAPQRRLDASPVDGRGQGKGFRVESVSGLRVEW